MDLSLTGIVDHLADLFYMISYLINITGIIVVLWGFAVALKGFIDIKMQGASDVSFFKQSARIRAELGTYILFGLEFLIAADILHTFIRPNMNDLVVLAIIVVIRTIISYFLGKEVDEAKHDTAMLKKKQKP